MFTNQNQSSGKFWVSAFIVGLLIFLGQFANSQVTRQQCGDRGAGTCGTTLDGKTCVFGIQYCNESNCKKREPQGYTYDGTLPYGQRCVQKKPQQAQENPNCNGSDVKFYPAAGGEPGEGNCICIATNQPAVDGKCKGEDVAELKTACEAVSGKFNPSDKSCNCGGEVFFGKMSPNEVCGAKTSEVSRDNWCSKAKGILGVHAGMGDSDMNCYCYDPTSDSPSGKITQGQTCNTAAAPAAEDEDAKFAKVLKDCGITDMEGRIAKCVEGSNKALLECDAEAIKSDSNAKQLGGVMKLLGTVQANKAVEHADPDACGTAAYAGSLATLAIDAFKKTCEGQIKSCKEKCQALNEGESFKNLKQKCLAEYNDKYGVGAQGSSVMNRRASRKRAKDKANESRAYRAEVEPDPNEVDRTDIIDMITTMEKEAKDNLVKCESDAVRGETDIGNYLAEILTSSMAAAQCRNLASNSAVRCAKLAPQLTPQYCQVNPSEVCCAPYIGSIIDCNGKDYSSKQCVCARSPDSSGCKTVVSTPPPTLTNPGGVANLAGPGGIKAGNQYKPSGTVGAGGFEVGTDMDPSKPTANAATGGSTNPFGVASGGGGGGGGGVPNSPNDGAAAAPPAAEGAGSGLVGGAFNQLKTLADRVFGSGSGNSNGKSFGTGTGKDGKKTGNESGKPGLRGVAGGSSVFGPRNKDIWKIMNVQYGIQNHTFISNEK